MFNYQRIYNIKWYVFAIFGAAFVLLIGVSCSLYFPLYKKHVQTIETMNKSLLEGFKSSVSIPDYTAVDHSLHVDLLFEQMKNEENYFTSTISVTLYRKDMTIDDEKEEVEIKCLSKQCEEVHILKEDIILGRNQKIDLSISPNPYLVLKHYNIITYSLGSSYTQVILIALILLVNVIGAAVLFIYLVNNHLLGELSLHTRFFFLSAFIFFSPFDILAFIVETWVFPCLHLALYVLFMTVVFTVIIHSINQFNENNKLYGVSKKLYTIGISILYGIFIIILLIYETTYVIRELFDPVSLNTKTMDIFYLTFYITLILVGAICFIVLLAYCTLTLFYSRYNNCFLSHCVQQSIHLLMFLLSLLIPLTIGKEFIISDRLFLYAFKV